VWVSFYFTSGQSIMWSIFRMDEDQEKYVRDALVRRVATFLFPYIKKKDIKKKEAEE